MSRFKCTIDEERVPPTFGIIDKRTKKPLPPKDICKLLNAAVDCIEDLLDVTGTSFDEAIKEYLKE